MCSRNLNDEAAWTRFGPLHHIKSRAVIIFNTHLLRLEMLNLFTYKKGKAVPLQARRGPEGSRKLRFPDFVTTAQDGGKVVNLTHRPPLHPGNTPGTHFC